ncbi:MAG: NTP transferase domain-containing protein [Ignavibacteriales bacterium]|nr:NTP transferase domain-containing protein [Ignavibacteriales bacterium]
MKLYAVIMAGGVGSRFWPRSREKTPKQLLNIIGAETMIQATVRRLEGLVDKDRIVIVTSRLHKEEILKQLPDVPEANVVAEPFGRNTAACVGVASLILKKIDPDAVSVVLPADHIIKDEELFRKTLERAAAFASESKGLTTIGVTPTRPETGYGYIQIDDGEPSAGIHPVRTFAEKPNYATAVRFVESGDFYWNSGMFIWRADAILEEMATYMPELTEALRMLEPAVGTERFDEALEEAYGMVKNISIDYGVMEKSDRVFLTKGEFAWNDVGSWEEVYQLTEKDAEGNAAVGDVYLDRCADSYVFSPGRFTAVVGVDNVIVINAGDAALVCRRDQAQAVKKVVEHLKLNQKNEYL